MGLRGTMGGFMTWFMGALSLNAVVGRAVKLAPAKVVGYTLFTVAGTFIWSWFCYDRFREKEVAE